MKRYFFRNYFLLETARYIHLYGSSVGSFIIVIGGNNISHRVIYETQ
nr:MAG TPA: hypothetical protein [Caudoviricetes sp.]